MPGPHDRRESAAWYEEDVEDGWRVAYRLLAQGNVVVIAEVRVFPADPARRGTPGEWASESAAVPPGGVTGAVVKWLRTELPVERAREVFADLTRGGSQAMASLDFTSPWGTTATERARAAATLFRCSSSRPRTYGSSRLGIARR